MAAGSRSAAEIRNSIERNRRELAVSVRHLQLEVHRATDWRSFVREHKPQAIAGAAVAAGVRLHTGTAVLAVEPGRVTTTAGVVRAEAVVLATEAWLHPPSYLLVVEDLEVTDADVTGPSTDRVRADLTDLPYPGGGAVFSTGSISWCGSLSHAGYDNDVARVTRNVLRRFLGER